MLRHVIKCRRLTLAVGCLLALPAAIAVASSPALVNLSSASLRAEPYHLSELETQAVYGTPLEIIDRQDEWLQVRVPDGYEAYVPASSVVEVSETEMDRWRASRRLIVVNALPEPVVADSTLSYHDAGNVITDLTIGSIMEGEVSPGSKFVAVTLPDGRRGFAKTVDVDDLDSWASRPATSSEVVDIAMTMMGIPYLWGGTTGKGLDCSGLSQTCYLLGARLLLPRNASQQARIGQELDLSKPELFRQGDLLFFGNDDRITHVAIYDGQTRYVHSSGRVHESSFEPDDALYIPRQVIKAVRIIGVPTIEKTMSIRENPLYFSTPATRNHD